MLLIPFNSENRLHVLCWPTSAIKANRLEQSNSIGLVTDLAIKLVNGLIFSALSMHLQPHFCTFLPHHLVRKNTVRKLVRMEKAILRRALLSN